MVYTLPLSCSTARLSYRFPFSSSSSFSKMALFFLSTASRSFSTTSRSFSTASRSRSMLTISDCSVTGARHCRLTGVTVRGAGVSFSLETSTLCVLVFGRTDDRDCTDDDCTGVSCTGAGGTTSATSTLPAHDTCPFF